MTTFAGRRSAGRNDFTSEWHVYEPHRVGLPPLGPYVREVWRRRQFIFEMSRANLRAEHFNTALGQLWLLLNPLFLAAVLFALVTIVRGGSRGTDFLAHLMLSLFAFRLVSGSVSQGAKSVTGGGKLILNAAFPRAVLPLSSVLTAFIRFLPTLILYGILHVVAGLPVGLSMLWGLPIVALLVVFGFGAAMLTATAQVYFRDLANFLPYFTRIWLYSSPIIYYASEVPERLKPIVAANPLFPMLASLSEAVVEGKAPTATYLAGGLAWAVAVVVLGGLFFVSREREFAVRL